jgi:hypothetical protein
LVYATGFCKDNGTVYGRSRKRGAARALKVSQNPRVYKEDSDKQKDMLAQKYARFGNFSKANQAICSDLKPLLGPTTLPKMQAKNPQRPLDFDDSFWPSQHDFSNLRQQCDWPTIEADFLSLKKIQKYWASRTALGAQDIDGWRGKEHFSRFWTGNNRNNP